MLIVFTEVNAMEAIINVYPIVSVNVIWAFLSPVTQMKDITLLIQCGPGKELSVPLFNAMKGQKSVILHQAFAAMNQISKAIRTSKFAFTFSAIITFPISRTCFQLKQQVQEIFLLPNPFPKKIILTLKMPMSVYYYK
jgi:ABC-type maltose transport system permease subunit